MSSFPQNWPGVPQDPDNSTVAKVAAIQGADMAAYWLAGPRSLAWPRSIGGLRFDPSSLTLANPEEFAFLVRVPPGCTGLHFAAMMSGAGFYAEVDTGGFPPAWGGRKITFAGTGGIDSGPALRATMTFSAAGVIPNGPYDEPLTPSLSWSTAYVRLSLPAASLVGVWRVFTVLREFCVYPIFSTVNK